MTDHLKTLRELVTKLANVSGETELVIGYAKAAEARPALAAMLRVVEAAKGVSTACRLACDAKGEPNAIDGWYQAQAILDAALRDLEPKEAEDAE